jgi:2-polyprenyl-6-methoxyphenol hydroxylase-like FAD-dependent oxidoreductase
MDDSPAAAPVDVDVLVVGAGPTGLVAAGEAVRHGLTVRIVDASPGRSTFSKALVVHARTMEVFDTMGVAAAVLAEGTPFVALNVHPDGRRRVTRVDLLDLPWGDTAYPFWLSIPQYATERVLEEHLAKAGVDVGWQVSLDSLREHGDHVEASLEHRDGTTEVLHSRWLIGCDGGRSRVREQAGLRLRRTSTGVTFVLADIITTAPLAADEGHVFLDGDGLVLIVPMPEPGRWRVIAQEHRSATGTSRTVDSGYLDELVRTRTGLDLSRHEVVAGSRFDLSQGVADRYRRGRVFLAGDAAHVHSPVGGQGLNTGVQDAHNLLWKLGLARRVPPAAAQRLLDSYQEERRPVAAAMVAGTARATALLTTRHRLLRRAVGRIAALVIALPVVRSKLGRGVGMLELGYPRGRLCTGNSRAAGRRMPNPVLRGGGRLHERLDPVAFTWVVLGPDQPAPDQDAPGWRGLPVLYLPAEEITGAEITGATLPPVTLVRPDRYIALAAASAPAAWAAADACPVAGAP